MPVPCMRPIAEGSVIRSMDYGEGGPDYQVHFAVTYGGCQARISGPPEDCYPGEAPEWEITGIDEEVWDAERKAYDWVPIERSHGKHEIESVESWAEMLDLADECAEALEGEREAALEWQAEQRRDGREDANRAIRERQDEKDMGW